MDERRQARTGRSGQGVLEEHVQDMLREERDADDAAHEEDAPAPERVAEERERLEDRP